MSKFSMENKVYVNDDGEEPAPPQYTESEAVSKKKEKKDNNGEEEEDEKKKLEHLPIVSSKNVVKPRACFQSRKLYKS